MKHPNILKAADGAWEKRGSGKKFEVMRKALGQVAGSKQLGCSLYRQAPGKKAFPYHFHLGIEEAIFVLQGRARLRLGDDAFELGKGDYVALPTGPKHAHQIESVGSVDLEYLCFSTMTDPDVVVYPDSEKVGLAAGFSCPEEKPLFRFFKDGTHVPYWTGELDDESQ